MRFKILSLEKKVDSEKYKNTRYLYPKQIFSIMSD